MTNLLGVPLFACILFVCQSVTAFQESFDLNDYLESHELAKREATELKYRHEFDNEVVVVLAYPAHYELSCYLKGLTKRSVIIKLETQLYKLPSSHLRKIYRLKEIEVEREKEFLALLREPKPLIDKDIFWLKYEKSTWWGKKSTLLKNGYKISLVTRKSGVGGIREIAKKHWQKESEIVAPIPYTYSEKWRESRYQGLSKYESACRLDPKKIEFYPTRSAEDILAMQKDLKAIRNAKWQEELQKELIEIALKEATKTGVKRLVEKILEADKGGS